MRYSRLFLAALLMLALAVSAFAAVPIEKQIEAEKKLGKDAADEAVKTLNFVTDEKYTKRVEMIGQKIASIAKTSEVPASYGRPELADFTYSFKVVEDGTTNAFALPAGYIYVNKGLIDRVESDDELAAVIAHEVAHVAHHHMYAILQKKSQLDTLVYMVLAAAVLGKAEGTATRDLFYGAQLVQMAKINAYTIEAEWDADNTAIEYMIKAKYNPVGMLTVMEGLARDHAYDPRIANQGITQNHPHSKDRVENIIKQLNKRGIPINRWEVETGTQATVRETTVGSKKVSEVVVGKITIFRPADTAESSSKERANAIAKRLNKIFRQNPSQWEIRLGADESTVFYRQQMVIDVRKADAELAGTTAEAVADSAKKSIQAALLGEQMRYMLP